MTGEQLRTYLEIVSIVSGDFARLIGLCTIGTDNLCKNKRLVAGDRFFCFGDDVVAHSDDNEGVMIVLKRLKSAAHIDQTKRSADTGHGSMDRAQITLAPRIERSLNSPRQHQISIVGSYSFHIRRVHSGRQY